MIFNAATIEMLQEGIWETRVSFVYSAKEHAVYYVQYNDFSQIEKYEFLQL